MNVNPPRAYAYRAHAPFAFAFTIGLVGMFPQFSATYYESRLTSSRAMNCPARSTTSITQRAWSRVPPIVRAPSEVVVMGPSVPPPEIARREPADHGSAGNRIVECRWRLLGWLPRPERKAVRVEGGTAWSRRNRR